MKFYGREFLKQVKPTSIPHPKKWKWKPAHPDWIVDASELVPKKPWVRFNAKRKGEPSVLVLGRRDAQMGVLLQQLDETGADALFVDLDHLSLHSGLSISHQGYAEFQLGHDKYLTRRVKHVYFAVPQFEVVLTDGAEKFSRDERLYFSRWMQAIEQLALVIPAPRWLPGVPRIVSPEAQTRFEDLHLAHRLKIRTPATIITNSQDVAEKFIKEHRDQVVFRETAFRFPQSSKKSYKFGIEKVDTQSRDWKWLAESPCVFQEYVAKKYEWRVVVVGNHTLACRIHSQSSKRSRMDWKEYDFPKVRFEAVAVGEGRGHFSRRLAQKLRRIMHSRQLRFASFDLVETPSGELVFLEMNRPGQWLFIEALSGLEISRALARELNR